MSRLTKQPQQRVNFISFFESLNDPRRTNRGNHQHLLADMVFLVISAVISGAVDWTHIEVFGKSQIEWLRKFRPFKNGIPSHDILGGVFASIDTKQFTECFIKWVSSIADITEGEVVAIDGKRIRGASDHNDKKSAIHVVSAFAADNCLSLGQVETSKKSNEIEAIPRLLEIIVTKGCIVTIDAMGCQKEIAKKIIEGKADYILAVKENQKELHDQVKKMFTGIAKQTTNTQIDAGHGRVETRTCNVVDNLVFMDEKQQWEKLRTVVKLESERYIKSEKKTTKETRYYISSLPPDAEKINNAIRKHWSIENKLHWTLDVIFGEDASQKRLKNSATNFNIISKIAMTLLSREKTVKLSMRAKRFKASLDQSLREKILRI